MTSRIFHVAIATLFTAGAAFAETCPGPDQFGHTCVDRVCADIATPSCFGNLLGDDNCTARTVGFSFNHYGATYNTVGVASNGFLQMGGCGDGSSDFTNDCPVPSANAPNNTVFGVWDDLHVQNVQARVCDGVSGIGPNRIYAAEYTAVPYFGGGGNATFQIQIHENGGPPAEAIFRVDIRSVGQPNGFTSGLEDLAGTAGVSRWCDASTGAVCTHYQQTRPPRPTR